MQQLNNHAPKKLNKATERWQMEHEGEGRRKRGIATRKGRKTVGREEGTEKGACLGLTIILTSCTSYRAVSSECPSS